MGKWTYCTRSGLIRCDGKQIKHNDFIRILNAHEPMLAALEEVRKLRRNGEAWSNATWQCVDAARAAAKGTPDDRK